MATWLPRFIFPKPAPQPVLHFIVYAVIPGEWTWAGGGAMPVQHPPRFEQMTSLFPSPGGAEALCQWLWDHDKSRTYRIFWNLGLGTPLKIMEGGDRSGSQWFDDLGCYGIGWWADIDWDKLYKGPN